VIVVISVKVLYVHVFRNCHKSREEYLNLPPSSEPVCHVHSLTPHLFQSAFLTA